MYSVSSSRDTELYHHIPGHENLMSPSLLVQGQLVYLVNGNTFFINLEEGDVGKGTGCLSYLLQLGECFFNQDPFPILLKTPNFFIFLKFWSPHFIIASRGEVFTIQPLAKHTRSHKGLWLGTFFFLTYNPRENIT